jgi:quinol-cytochrome oxidoreductase complex cytochrome b subunit
MTKYTRVIHRADERRWNIHPVWRGIGCFMILIIIVMSYAGAKEFTDYNQKAQKLDLPNFLYNKVQIPYTKYIPALKQDDVVNKFLAHVKVGYLIFMLIFMVIGFGAYSFIYSALYRVSGPSRDSVIDSPEVRRPRRR